VTENISVIDDAIAYLGQDIANKLTQANLSVCTAESLTGGMVGDTIVNVPGASKYYKGGVIAYLDMVKHTILHVNSELLRAKGDVHPDVAYEMAVGARGLFGANCAISTTGYAGPYSEFGEEVGLVYICVLTEKRHLVKEFRFLADEKYRPWFDVAINNVQNNAQNDTAAIDVRKIIRHLAVIEGLRLLSANI
jgi:nicotinamide-nucleotide amidase